MHATFWCLTWSKEHHMRRDKWAQDQTSHLRALHWPQQLGQFEYLPDGLFLPFRTYFLGCCVACAWDQWKKLHKNKSNTVPSDGKCCHRVPMFATKLASRVHHKHLPQHWLTPFSQLSGGCRIFRASLGLRGTCTRINPTHKPEAPFRQENLGNSPCKSQHLAPWSSFAPSYAYGRQFSASESWQDFEAKPWSQKEGTLVKESASTNMHSCRNEITAVLLPCVPLQTNDAANMIREITFRVQRVHFIVRTNEAKGPLVLLDMRGMANCKTVKLLPNLSKRMFFLWHSFSSVKAIMCNYKERWKRSWAVAVA